MTGPITWEVLLWFIGSIFVILLVAWRVIDWLLTQLSKRDDDLQAEAASLRLQIEAVNTRAKMAEDVIAKSLSDHKLYAAENFATEGGLTQAVNRVDDAVKRLTDRMDRYFEKSDNPPPRRRSPVPRD